MTDNNNTDGGKDVPQMLRRLFEVAATKSIASVDPLDAEPEMAAFLHLIKSHPELRQFAIKLFTDSFSESRYRSGVPSTFMMFSMHDLRWADIRDFIESKKKEDVEKHGSRRSGIWDDILEAFNDDWEPAKYFEEFKGNKSGP